MSRGRAGARRRTSWLLGAAMALATACAGPASGGPRPKLLVAPAAAASAPAVREGGALTGKAKIPTGVVAGGGGLISDKGVGVVANAGGQVVSNGGSQVIANGGGQLGAPAIGFRLLAEGQRPLVGFKVRLVDASGAPALDPAGRPYEAETDADGAFAFARTPAGRSLVVELALPGALGRLVGFAPASGGSGEVALEGVGTHVLGYVLAQVVQGDQARLERLDAASEAAARADAEAALAQAAGGVIAADSLAPASLVATVGVWRELSAPFDARLAAIERQVAGK